MLRRYFRAIEADPAIAHLDVERRQRLSVASNSRAIKSWQFWVWSLSPPAFLISWFLYNYAGGRGPSGLALMVGHAVWTCISLGVQQQMRRRALEVELFAASLRPSECLRCGYDVRASHQLCPECGSEIPGTCPEADAQSRATAAAASLRPSRSLVLLGMLPLLVLAGVSYVTLFQKPARPNAIAAFGGGPVAPPVPAKPASFQVHTSRTVREVKRFGPGERGVDLRIDDRAGLWATFSPGVDDAELSIVAGLSSLREVNLTALSNVTDAGLASVANLPQLERFSVGSPHVTDAGVAHLAGATGLVVLQLETCPRVTDAGLDHLAGLTNLQLLSLAGTGVTDAGLAKLHGAKKLRHVDLSGTAVTNEGVARLRDAIPGVTIRR